MTNISKPPQIDNAPGLTWRVRKYGWEARWRARADLVGAGFLPKNRRLWISTKEQPELTEAAILSIQDQCNSLQSEMLVWGRGGVPSSMVFDGTVASLARCYQTDADSRYRKVRFKTRGYYDRLIARLIRDHGDEPLSTIKARQLLRWHEDWTAGGKVSMAHSLMGMFRTLVGFGATFLEDAECERLSVAMHRMRFAMGKARTETLTADQVVAIRKEAHRQDLPSIALAQALQFELMLRQKDVIGEWVPIPEPGHSAITNGNEKWLRGVRWNEVDQNLILRHITSKRQKEIVVYLKLAPMVVEELNQSYPGCVIQREITHPITKEVSILTTVNRDLLPSSSAIILCERTQMPWDDGDFRRRWRVIADACGIPKTVRNMDSRASGITEATDAGAELEHVRHAATHGDISMTQRYSRASTEKTAGVMVKRVAHRNKSGT